MESINNVSLRGAIARINELLEAARSADSQLKAAANILTTPGMNENAVTMLLIEHLPNLGKSNVPILGLAASANVHAITPFGKNAAKAVFAPLNIDPATNFELHIATVTAKLRLLEKGQNDLLRALFMNRFRVLQEFNSESVKFSTSSNHVMHFTTVYQQGATEIFRMVESLLADLQVLADA